jgi:hypothetical protein
MKKRKSTTHTGIRNSKFFCFNCGDSQKIPFPITIPMFGTMSKQFDAEHRNCLPAWKQPVVDQSLPILDRAKWWLDNGERGMSSDSMFFNLCPELKAYVDHSLNYPGDPDDFRRCYMLIEKTIPEWKSQLWSLRQLSPQWMQIVDNWDKLCFLLEEQLEGKENKMWEFMKLLLKD